MEDSQWSPTIPVLPSCFSHIFADAVSSAIRCIECSIGPQLNAIAWRPYPQTIQRCAALLNDFPYCSGVRFCPAVCWRPPSRAFELPLRCAAPYDDEEVGYAAIENVAGEARPSGHARSAPNKPSRSMSRLCSRGRAPSSVLRWEATEHGRCQYVSVGDEPSLHINHCTLSAH